MCPGIPAIDKRLRDDILLEVVGITVHASY
jgi:hypothetical protein